MTNPYRSVHDFALTHRLILPKPQHWWLLEPECGQINAIPRFRGFTVATNGIIVAILTPTFEVLFGHREWFIKDNLGVAQFRPLTPPVEEKSPDISEYV